MDQSLRKFLLIILYVPVMIASCNTGEKENKFTVTGTIKNHKASLIFLEEVIPTTLIPIMVDSSTIKLDGSFSLSTEAVSEKVYILRLNNNIFPFASLINDASAITVIADFDNRENLYSVEGSKLSQTIKEISTTYPKKWADLLDIRRVYDSLQETKRPDSLLIKKMYTLGDSSFADIKNGIYNYLHTSSSPTFSWYLLRNFQHLFTVEEYSDELQQAEKKFPGNEMLIAARNRLNQQIAEAIEKQKKEDQKSKPVKPKP
jgi:hypothetical protein